MPQSNTLDVGKDIYQESIAVAYIAKDHDAEVVSLGSLGTRQGDIDQLIRQRQSKSHQRVLVYEAGPCGDWLYRDLTKKGHVYRVVAPRGSPKRRAMGSKPTGVTRSNWPA